MRKILNVTYMERPFLDVVLNTNSEKYEVDVVHTLEDALKSDLFYYDAVVFNMLFARGNLNNLGELGLYPLPLVNDPLSENPSYSGMRLSDQQNGWIFALMARLPKSNGGLGYKGGLATLTFLEFHEARYLLNGISKELKSIDEKLILPNDIIHLQIDYSPEMADTIREGVKKASDIYFDNTPTSTKFMPETNYHFSTS